MKKLKTQLNHYSTNIQPLVCTWLGGLTMQWIMWFEHAMVKALNWKSSAKSCEHLVHGLQMKWYNSTAGVYVYYHFVITTKQLYSPHVIQVHTGQYIITKALRRLNVVLKCITHYKYTVNHIVYFHVHIELRYHSRRNTMIWPYGCAKHQIKWLRSCDFILVYWWHNIVFDNHLAQLLLGILLYLWYTDTYITYAPHTHISCVMILSCSMHRCSQGNIYDAKHSESIEPRIQLCMKKLIKLYGYVH